MPSRETATHPAFSAPRAPDASGSALRLEWGRVRVERIDAHDAPGTRPGRVIHASVHLGTLVPSEALVELTCEDADGRLTAATAEPLRMWSECAYENGSYLFVARMIAQDLAGVSRLRVCVRPAGVATREPVASTCLTLPVSADAPTPSAPG